MQNHFRAKMYYDNIIAKIVYISTNNTQLKLTEKNIRNLFIGTNKSQYKIKN